MIGNDFDSLFKMKWEIINSTMKSKRSKYSNPKMKVDTFFHEEYLEISDYQPTEIR
jgi:hypothetical protein